MERYHLVGIISLSGAGRFELNQTKAKVTLKVLDIEQLGLPSLTFISSTFIIFQLISAID
jgi:hypothetical protein